MPNILNEESAIMSANKRKMTKKSQPEGYTGSCGLHTADMKVLSDEKKIIQPQPEGFSGLKPE